MIKKRNTCPVCKTNPTTPDWLTCSTRCERVFCRYDGDPWKLFAWRHRFTRRGYFWLSTVRFTWQIATAATIIAGFWVVYVALWSTTAN